MKIVIRTVIFHFLCIAGFGITYFYLKDDFSEKEEADLEIIDYMLLSTTIQAGVGVSDLYPTSFYGKLTMIIQQLLMICTHIFTIYIFTI
jgi:hypothetical protein